MHKYYVCMLLTQIVLFLQLVFSLVEIRTRVSW